MPILQNLGGDHVPRGVQKEHYPVVMNAVIKTLKDNLGSDFTPAVKKSWKLVLNVVQETMIGDNYEKKEILPEDAAEALLIPEDPALHKDNTYRNMESYAITV